MQKVRKYFGRFLYQALLIMIYVFLYAGISNAATYYVSPNGSATWEQAQNISTPCSATTAMQNAQAGDIVYFRGGVYNLWDSPNYHAALEPSHSGTADNPITFIAYTGETPVLNIVVNEPAGDYADYCIGNGDKDYIIIDGFKTQCNGGAHLGGIIITGANIGRRVVGCVVRNCEMDGGDHVMNTTDNRECLRIEDTSNTLIQNCKIYNARQVNNWHNTSAIKMYDNDHTIIENCEIYNCTTGIYVKSSNDYCTYRYNYIHDNNEGFLETHYCTAKCHNADSNKVYQNVFANNNACAIQFYGQETAHADNAEIYSNTIYSRSENSFGISFSQGQHVKVYNNVIQVYTYKQLSFGCDNYSIAECDHNQFGTTSLEIKTHVYQDNHNI